MDDYDKIFGVVFVIIVAIMYLGVVVITLQY